MNKQQFIEGLKKNDLEYKIVNARWPYNYNDNKAYEAINQHGVKMYFFFNSDGLLLEKKTMGQIRNYSKVTTILTK